MLGNIPYKKNHNLVYISSCVKMHVRFARIAKLGQQLLGPSPSFASSAIAHETNSHFLRVGYLRLSEKKLQNLGLSREEIAELLGVGNHPFVYNEETREVYGNYTGSVKDAFADRAFPIGHGPAEKGTDRVVPYFFVRLSKYFNMGSYSLKIKPREDQTQILFNKKYGDKAGDRTMADIISHNIAIDFSPVADAASSSSSHTSMSSDDVLD